MMEHGYLFKGVGFSFVFLTPVFQYLTYEIRNPNEYFFYYNLGLSKLVLWTSTLVISLIIGLIFILL